MFRAVSTTEKQAAAQLFLPAVAQKACITMVVIAMASNGIVSSVPKQISRTNSCAYFSTDSASKEDYTNGNINLWWDGDSVMSSDKYENLLRIDEIGQLQDDWNGNGASSFSEELLSTAKGIVRNTPVQASIFPTARDSIQFEYENDDDDYLELEVFEDKRVKKFLFDHNGNSLTEYIAIDDISEVVSEFYGRNVL